VNELILAHRWSAGWRWSSLNDTASIKLALSVAGCVSADTILLMLNGQPLDEEPREITPRNGESLKLNRVRFWCASGKSQADLPGHTQHGSETQQLRGWFERTRRQSRQAAHLRYLIYADLIEFRPLRTSASGPRQENHSVIVAIAYWRVWQVPTMACGLS
jgi:hypothetical protein